jgi:hypothetical protein
MAEQGKSVLSSDGARKLIEEGGENLTEDERALLSALLSVEVETGAELSEEERAALNGLMDKLEAYDVDDLMQAVKHLVTAKSRKGHKLKWPELGRRRRK